MDLSTTEGRQSFYQTKEWKALRNLKIKNNCLCEECIKTDLLTPATEVHHIIDIDDRPTLENALSYDGLMSLCKSCHSSITQKNRKKQIWKPFNPKAFKESIM